MNTVVIDANIGVSLVIPLAYSPRVQALWAEWRAENTRLLVPALWHYEVLSSLRKAVEMGVMDTDAAESGVKALRMLALVEAPPDWDSDHRILDWANRLQQTVAYDAVYVALAEHVAAHLWTADGRLVRAARAAGADWVHHVADLQDAA